MYAENLVSRLSDAKKQFDCIKADLRRSQREHYDQNVRYLQVRVGMCVYIRRPFPATQLQGLTPRFTHRFDGPFVVQGHIHGLQDLLKLRHEITGQDIGAVTIEKIVIASATDLQELRPENETHSQPNPPAPSKSVSSNVAK